MNRIIVILGVLIMVSCTSRTIYKKPDDLIPKDQMVALWTNIYIAHGARSVKNKKLERRLNYMPLVYKKFNIDSARFMRSNIYYTSRIEDYEKMFKKVQGNIQKLKKKYDNSETDLDQNIPILQKDSLKRVKNLKIKERLEKRVNE